MRKPGMRPARAQSSIIAGEGNPPDLARPGKIQQSAKIHGLPA
jgi:hypothetical protein